MDDYIKSESLREIGYEVIHENRIFSHLDDGHLKIQFLYCSKEKKKVGMLVYADTEKVSDKVRYMTGYDFVVTFYEPNCDGLSRDILKKIMYHELKHIGYEPPKKMYIVPHDVQDFSEIINRWGMDWVSE